MSIAPARTPVRSSVDALTADLVASTGRTVPIPSPATGEPISDLPRSSADDVRGAVSRARLAQLAWARLGFAERRRVLLRAHDLLLDRREELLDLTQLESGKTRGQAFEEVFQAASVTRWNALMARRVLGGGRRRSGIPLVLSTRVRYRPKGVVGVITPWNYGVSLAAMDVVPALAAGCAVVQKADDQGALSVLALRRAFIDAGLPEAVWAVVAGDPGEAGEALTDEVDYICFTGSTATGRRIAEKAGRRLVGASLELGGKNALIVLDDVDVEQAAADAAHACFSSMGQLCVSIERIYVHRRVAEPFTAALVARLSDPRIGSGLDHDADYGSLATEAQLQRVRSHLEDAVAKGARVVVGGRARPDIGPWAFEPTILADVAPDMRAANEETFGAIASIAVVDDETEAVLLANESEYGLNASVLTGSTRHGLRLAHEIDAGSVNVNEGYRGSFGSVDAPMGGLKESGIGRRNGVEGLRRFVDPVTISINRRLIPLPHTGREYARLVGPLVLLARVLRAIRRA
ncbi:succinic semialdehyde dehydrogenase [Agromyces indicus]|uniref:Succinic semialdehyde dehydrogenase n=1 Tax=Agromyces indicus TaxID=758919 RepID=A0ABU1FJ53_9MICO|nr:succinic semialdehyde dehydrogenase [Agromyces indicus]MDR5691798.1 succinic semialdehyde dehydrogenase [Agromyces indicus]